MFSQYFGNYLLEQDLLTPIELKHVLNKKNNIYMKLGALAIHRKYLTPEQVEYIHELQENSDMKFGELAVLYGFLSNAQLLELVKLQKNENSLLVQVLVEDGFFTPGQINTILDNYRAQLGLSKYEFEALKNNDLEKIIETFAKLDNVCGSAILNDYILLFIRNIVRFIDSGVKLGQAEEIREYDFKWLVFQNMCGEIDLFTGFASDDEGMRRFGCRFANRVFGEVDDYVLSSAGEFINLQNGLFLSRLSEEGTEPELQAQEWKSGGRLTAPGGVIKLPVQLSYGKFDFFISGNIPQLSDGHEAALTLSSGRGL